MQSVLVKIESHGVCRGVCMRGSGVRRGLCVAGLAFVSLRYYFSHAWEVFIC